MIRLSDMAVLVMAGGTGGHVFPALAVAEALRSRGVTVTWMGTRRGLEARLVPPTGIAIDWIAITGLRGKGARVWIMAPWRLLRSLAQAVRILADRRPQLVLGMGGFVTGPGGVAAWLLRIPLVVHEQNSVAGLTNRLLAHLASRTLEGFPGSFPEGRGARLVGNPVRPAITRLRPPAERYRGRAGGIRVLVVGGSLGARILNETVPAAIATLSPDVRPEVWHQAGRETLELARIQYQGAGLRPMTGPTWWSAARAP
jgi:UDP-N-acetylglucosamine--N-acetylmuramyl-(pentapeptide) pyrophosphoryl-undecaprenol N-acetylglucosamine transferase